LANNKFVFFRKKSFAKIEGMAQKNIFDGKCKCPFLIFSEDGKYKLGKLFGE
jgi:hypothetical protein